jgi:hypothetical protein
LASDVGWVLDGTSWAIIAVALPRVVFCAGAGSEKGKKLEVILGHAKRRKTVRLEKYEGGLRYPVLVDHYLRSLAKRATTGELRTGARREFSWEGRTVVPEHQDCHKIEVRAPG